MGLFSARGRRAETEAIEAPSATPDEPSATPPGQEDGVAAASRADVDLTNLKEQLQQLFAGRPARDAFAQEALQLMAGVAAVPAAALLNYNVRKNQLRGLAHVGLEEEAVKALGGGMGSSWDIPLRSLRNRRINVIESAHENPFVPDVLKAITGERLTIATIPFFHANTPIGVCVFFSAKPRAFADDTLRALSQGLRVCGVAIHELPSAALVAKADVSAVEEDGDNKQPNLLRGLAALKSELARLSSALEESERLRAGEAAERVTAQSFLKATKEKRDQAERELAELKALLHEREAQQIPLLEKDIGALKERLADALRGSTGAHARIAELEASLADNGKLLAAKESEVATLAARRDELAQELEASAAQLRQQAEVNRQLEQRSTELAQLSTDATALRGELQSTEKAARDAAARIKTLEDTLTAAEENRAQTLRELADSQAALEKAKGDYDKLSDDLQQSWEKIEQLERSHEAVAKERDTLRKADETHRQRLQELETKRATLETEGREQSEQSEQLKSQVAALEAQRKGLHEELERLRSESGQTVDELRGRLEKTDRDRIELADRLAALSRAEEERARLQTRADQLEKEVAEARGQAEQVASRAAELTEKTAQLEQEKGSLEKRIESLLAGEKDLQRELSDALNTANEKIKGFEAEIERRDALHDKTKSELEFRLESSLGEAESSLAAARSELAEAAARAEKLQAELTQAREDGEVRDELLAMSEGERGKLAARAEELQTARDRLATELGAVQENLARSTAEEAHAAARVAELEQQLARLRDDELAAALAKLAETETARQASDEALRAVQEQFELEALHLQDQLALLTQEKEQLARALEEKDQLLQSAEHDLTAIDLDEEGEEEDLALEIDRSGAGDAGAAASADAAAEDDQIVLLDIDAIAAAVAQQLTEVGHRVTAMSPHPEGLDALVTESFTYTAINLAAPSAWPTLRRMRNGSGVPQVPMVAYALNENAPKGFWLGPVDFAVLPTGDGDLRKLLNRLAPKIRRVIAMSHDFDLMGEVRAQLTKAGISTAVVLDGKQALELVPTVRPQAAILHLSPNCTDVFRAVAGLRANEEARNIPILFLLDLEAQPREEAFVTSGLRMLTGRGTLVPDDLGRCVATAIDEYRNAA